MTPPAPRPAKGLRERDLYEAIVRLLRLHGVHVTRLAQSRASRQTEGVPDLFLMWADPQFRVLDLSPTVCWVEVKTLAGRLSPAQAAWHAMACRAGLRVYVWRSVEAVLDWLRDEGLRRPEAR